MVIKQKSNANNSELERLKNFHEYYYQRDAKILNSNLKKLIIIITISILILIAHQIITIVTMRKSPPIKISETKAITIYFILVVSNFIVIITSIYFFDKNKRGKDNLKLVSI